MDKLDVMYDHYKDTFSIQKENESTHRRDEKLNALLEAFHTNITDT